MKIAVEEVKKIKPDLILLDLALPYLSGFEICKKIRLFSDIPIIIISGKSTAKDLEALFLLGIDDFVQKPFNIKEVILRVIVKNTKYAIRVMALSYMTAPKDSYLP